MSGSALEDALVARLEAREDGSAALGAPGVGLWRDGPAVGRVVRPGEPIGRLETLGRLRVVLAPPGAAGVVVARHAPGQARPPVGYGTPLVVLDPQAAGSLGEATPGVVATASGGLVLPAPMGGRYYLRSGPGKPAFVQVGDVIEHGHTVGLVEVMKTFNRVLYGGAGLPSPARVKAILRSDDEDVTSGDPLLEVEPV